jgi:hypothetical protein
MNLRQRKNLEALLFHLTEGSVFEDFLHYNKSDKVETDNEVSAKFFGTKSLYGFVFFLNLANFSCIKNMDSPYVDANPTNTKIYYKHSPLINLVEINYALKSEFGSEFFKCTFSDFVTNYSTSVEMEEYYIKIIQTYLKQSIELDIVPYSVYKERLFKNYEDDIINRYPHLLPVISEVNKSLNEYLSNISKYSMSGWPVRLSYGSLPDIENEVIANVYRANGYTVENKKGWLVFTFVNS